MRYFFVFFGLLILSSPASANATLWICGYSGFGQGAGQVLRELLQRDGFLYNYKTDSRYQILQDNKVGLVAVRSRAILSPIGLHLGANIIVINKDTGDLLTGPFAFGLDETLPNVAHRQGKCTQRPLP